MRFHLRLVFIIITCLLFFSNIYKNEFVFDDPDIILNNKAIQNICDLKSILTTNYWHDKANAGLYRPFVFITYAVDYYLWGKNPVGYHFINIIAHILVCFFVFLILRELKIKEESAFLASVLFAVHPVHTEAVTGIVGRAEVITTMFFCISWFSFFKVYKKVDYNVENIKIIDKYMIISSLSYLLALCTKENSFIFPIIVLMTIIYFESAVCLKKITKSLVLFIPYGLMFSVYMAIRWQVIGSVGPAGTEQFFHSTPVYSIFLTMLRVFAWYLKLLILPTDLVCVYRQWDISTTFFDWRVLLSMSIVIIWLWITFLFFKERKLWQFLSLFILVCLLPVSNIILIGDIMAERFLYLPSIGYCALFVIASTKFSDFSFKTISLTTYKRVLCAFFATVFILMGIGTLKRNAEWKNGIIFWKTTIKDIPYSYSAYYNLAYSFWEKGYKKKAIEVLRRSLRNKPDHAETRKFLGYIYDELGDYDQAIYQYTILLKTNPEVEDGYSNLALTYMKKGMYDKAISTCITGLSQVDRKSSIYHALIRIYINRNDIAKAISAAQDLIAYDPKEIRGYIKLGDCYDALKQFDRSREYYYEALSLDNKNLETLDKIASLFFRQHDYHKALKFWERANKLYPAEEYIWYYKGLCYENLGNIEKAVQSWQMVLNSGSYGHKAADKINQYKTNVK